MQVIEISRQMAGGRLDKLLLRFFDLAGSGFVYKMLRKKNILLNGKRAAGSEILQEGDSVTLFLADDTIRKFHSEREGYPDSGRGSDRDSDAGMADMPPLAPLIVYEDDNVLAVSKPAGILSQRSDRNQFSLNDMVREYLAGCGEDRMFTPGIANRLDRNTSGLVLAGKNPAAQRSLSLAMKDRGLHKFYDCLVKGVVTEGAVLQGFLLKDAGSNTVRVFGYDESHPEDAQYIRTDYRVIDHSKGMDRSGGPGCSLLEADLITGRPHQIRAHLASRGMPVVGDGKYGDREVNAWFRKRYGVKEQLLHAGRISFTQMTGILDYLNGRVITAEIPGLFRKVLEGEGLCLRGSQGD